MTPARLATDRGASPPPSMYGKLAANRDVNLTAARGATRADATDLRGRGCPAGGGSQAAAPRAGPNQVVKSATTISGVGEPRVPNAQS